MHGTLVPAQFRPILVINADRQRSFDLNMPTVGERYTLTAKQHEDKTFELNRNPLQLTSGGDPPQFKGDAVSGGHMSSSPLDITCLAVANISS